MDAATRGHGSSDMGGRASTTEARLLRPKSTSQLLMRAVRECDRGHDPTALELVDQGLALEHGAKLSADADWLLWCV